MKNKVLKILIILILPVFAINCKKDKPVTASIKFIRGDVFTISHDQKKPATVGQKIASGDSIQTGKDGLAILEFDDKSSQIEIQPNAVLDINKYGNKLKELMLESGNAWVSVKKLDRGSNFYLLTPTSTAGVRGTKFYTFTLPGGIYATCHCEGKIHYNPKTSDFDAVNDKDYIAFTKGNITVTVTPEEMGAAGISDTGHNHSMIDNSPLGKKHSLTPEEEKIFFSVVEKKFAQAAAANER